MFVSVIHVDICQPYKSLQNDTVEVRTILAQNFLHLCDTLENNTLSDNSTLKAEAGILLVPCVRGPLVFPQPLT